MKNVLERDTAGAFCRHTHVEAAGAADGPLASLTCGIKDLYDIGGHKTGFGSPAWLETHAPAAAEPHLQCRGCSMRARTSSADPYRRNRVSLNGENPHYGTPSTSTRRAARPGGSSSGSAAAVAAGFVDFALAGYRRLGARAGEFCGIYGLRPTHGRIPLDGACALAASFDVAGPFARDPALLSASPACS